MLFSIIRHILLYLSQAKWAKWLAYNMPFSELLSRRFVAGYDIPQALKVIQQLEEQGFLVTVDRLGEFVANAEEARETGDNYRRLLHELHQQKSSAGISVKLTQLGLTLSCELATEILTDILEEAKKSNTFVRIDMEDRASKDKTLEIFTELRPRYPNLGIVLQAYLKETKRDLELVQSLNGSVRLCKGAYNVSAEYAYQEPEQINTSYRELSEQLLKDQAYHGFATHDDYLIKVVQQQAHHNNLDNDSYEFQMLYGVRPELQKKLVQEGQRVRIYLPYGKDWYSYYLRRIAERPQNLLFVLRALFQ